MIQSIINYWIEMPPLITMKTITKQITLVRFFFFIDKKAKKNNQISDIKKLGPILSFNFLGWLFLILFR